MRATVEDDPIPCFRVLGTDGRPLEGADIPDVPKVGTLSTHSTVLDCVWCAPGGTGKTHATRRLCDTCPPQLIVPTHTDSVLNYLFLTTLYPSRLCFDFLDVLYHLLAGGLGAVA